MDWIRINVWICVEIGSNLEVVDPLRGNVDLLLLHIIVMCFNLFRYLYLPR